MEEAKTISYELTFDQKKNLTPQEQTAMIKTFNHYDLNKDGKMDDKEFKNILIDLGYRKITDEKVKEMLNEHDASQDGFLQWNEFVDMMIKMKGSDDGRFGAIVEGKDGKAMAIVTSAGGGTHAYSIEERTTFAKMINHLLAENEDLKEFMPMNTEDDTLFHSFTNGLLLCKLVQKIDKEAIDERAINK